MIPRIFHKIWFNFNPENKKGNTPPKEYIDEEKNCLEINKDWKIMEWDEQSCLVFLKRYYNFFYDKFINYKYQIQKVDAIRYFILYHYGGVYMDMDIKCIKTFDIFNENKIYLVEDSNPLFNTGINNFLMASPKKHEFWLHVFDQLSKNYNSLNILRCLHILKSAGPGMLNDAYKSYQHKNQIIILSKELFNPCDTCGVCKFNNNYIIHQSHAKWTAGFEEYCLYLYCNRYNAALIIFIMIVLFLLIFFSIKIIK